MARKKFAHVTREIPRPTEIPYWPTSLRGQGLTNPMGRPLRDRWRNQVGLGGKSARSLVFYPTDCGYNDPLTITCVVDQLLNYETDSYIEAGPMTEDLQKAYGHLVRFDAYTVGKILSRLAQEERDVETRPATDAILLYVNSGGARKYAVAESFHGWLWLAQVRDYFGKAAEHVREERRKGRNPLRIDRWEGINALPWGVSP